MDTDLHTKVDLPDLEEALSNDRDGSFGISVQKYLADWKVRIQAELNRGLPASEFQALTLLSKGMESADRILLFLIATKSHPAPAH